MHRMFPSFCVPLGDLMLGENSQQFEFREVNCCRVLYAIPMVVAQCFVRITQIREEGFLMQPQLASACSSPASSLLS